jgi:hypothetical protein
MERLLRREHDDGPLFRLPPPTIGGSGGGRPPGSHGTFRGLPVYSEAEWKALPKGMRRCPECGQETIDRLRGISRRSLIYLVTLAGGDVKHIRRSHREETGDGEMGGDYAKLRYWGLTEQPLGEKRGGRWMLTQLGCDWLFGEVAVPRQVGLAEWKAKEVEKLLCFVGPWIKVGDVPGDPVDVASILASGRGGLK